MDWKATIAAVAPGLATALGGPLAGVAAAAVSEALLGRPDAPEAEIVTALQTGGTDALVKLREAEQAFTLRCKELGIDLERINAADRADARKLQTAAPSRMPATLSLLITGGFFGALGYLLHYGKPDQGGDALMILLGALGTAWSGVTAFWFGSTSGSQRKTDLLAQSKPVD
jgi:hypothetical protein